MDYKKLSEELIERLEGRTDTTTQAEVELQSYLDLSTDISELIYNTFSQFGYSDNQEKIISDLLSLICRIAMKNAKGMLEIRELVSLVEDEA